MHLSVRVYLAPFGTYIFDSFQVCPSNEHHFRYPNVWHWASNIVSYSSGFFHSDLLAGEFYANEGL